MASYEKIMKYLVEKFQASLAPLEQITKNQEVIIVQNKKVIDLLTQLNSGRQPDIAPETELSESLPLPASMSSETEA